MKIFYGLIFVGAILLSSSTYAKTCPDNEIKSLIGKLDKSKVESIVRLSKKIKAYSKGKKYGCVEPLLVDFISFYYQSLGEFTKANGIWSLPYPMPRKKRSELVSRVKNVGWVVKETEGSYYIGEEGGWLLKEFKSILSKSWKNYFALRDVEIKEGFSEDGGLIITWEKLGDRIINWERFLARYPRFPLNKSVNYYHTLYVRTLLSGIDNSRISGWEDNRLFPEVKREYERFIKVNIKSKYHQIFKDYYEVLSKNKFVVDGKAILFLKKANVKSMLATHAPTY